MSLEITLQNAISGLQSSKTSLQVISNNIANVNTEGYSRKVIEQSSRIIDGRGYGVEITDITRSVDEGVLKQLRSETGTLENLAIKEDFLTQLNTFFGRPADDNSIPHMIAELGAQFDALAVTPETASTQFLAVKAAQDVISELERMADEVQRLRGVANSRINETLTEFNSLTKAVVDINTDIIQFSASNISTAELEDERDRSLNRLAEIMDINYFQKSDGGITIFSGSGNTIVDGQAQTLTYSPPATVNAVLEYTPTDAVNYSGPNNGDYPIGGIPGIFVGEIAASTDITSGVADGALKALLDLRDSDLPTLQSQLDELSEKLKKELNQIHNQGSGFPPPPTLTGQNFVESSTVITGSSGLVIIGVVDTDGIQQETVAFDLSTYSTVSDITTAVTAAFTDLTASVTSDGFLELTAANGNRVAINEMTSSMTGAGKLETGFSDYFGLNNLYTTSENYSAYRSNYSSSSSSAVITTSGTVSFSLGGANQSVAIAANLSLSGIAAAVNAGVTGVTAEVIADGDGFRLEVTNDNGNNMSITSDSTSSFFADTGMRTDTRGISNRLDVRADIVSNTFFLSRGALQSNTFESGYTTIDPATLLAGGTTTETLVFHIDSSTSTTLTYDASGGAGGDSLNSMVTAINSDATLSAANITAEVVISGTAYSIKINDGDSDNLWVIDSGTSATGLGMATSQGVAVGDASVAASLAAEFKSSVTFLESPARGGGLAQTNTTLETYGSNILSFNSVQVSAIQRDLNFQQSLAQELYSKHTSISGVNMDEELANMIIFEQAYLAAARMITTTQELFKVLTNMV